MRSFALSVLLSGLFVLGVAYFLNQTGVSDPVTPANLSVATAACAPHGGLVSVQVRRRHQIENLTIQCTNGAVITMAPKTQTQPKTSFQGTIT